MNTETNKTNANARSQIHTLSLYSCSDRVCRQTEFYFIIVTLVQSTSSFCCCCCYSSLVLCAELWFAVVLLFLFFHFFFLIFIRFAVAVVVYARMRLLYTIQRTYGRPAHRQDNRDTCKQKQFSVCCAIQPRGQILIIK